MIKLNIHRGKFVNKENRMAQLTSNLQSMTAYVVEFHCPKTM